MKKFYEKVYLHIGCRGSEPWDLAFQSILTEWGIKYEICNLKSDVFDEERIFIGRINEYCRNFKKFYVQKSKFFKKMWPEPLAMYLYDDKFSQVDFLKNYPTPFQEVVFSKKFEFKNFKFPIVIKKAEGSASKNVYLANDKSQIKFYPCLAQEFCENNKGDYRIVIIGDYAMGSFRHNRPKDFRASGSNRCQVLSELPMEAVYLAYDVCKKHNFVTMSFDFLKLNDKWVIVEMSYTYPIYSITRDCKFYIDLSNNDKRIETTPDPARLVLSEILKT